MSQFSNEDGNTGLRDAFPGLPKGIYPVGRLDLDSEGLLILTDDKSLNNKLLNPKHNHTRTYWVEVEGKPDSEAIEELKKGLDIKVNGKVHRTKSATVNVINPVVRERNPPVNYQKHPKRTWIQMSLTEGKNRQVRRMTAKVGHPTLRLIRVSIQDLKLDPLESGEVKMVSKKLIYEKLRLYGNA